MSDYRTLNRTILAKVESTSGTDASPVVGTDAVLVENPATAIGIGALNTNEVTGALDARSPIPGGGGGSHSCVVNLHGSGAGGTAPEWGALMRGCAFSEATLASDETGTAQAGATGSITLAASGPSSTDDTYNGMVITTTGGTGSGQTRVITDYNGTTKVATIYPNWSTTPDATTTYAIKACALYQPASSSLATLTIYDYFHSSSGANSELRKLLGAAGNVGLTFQNGGISQASFAFQGKWGGVSNVAAPGAATFQSQRPVPFMSADISLGGSTTKLNQFSFDCGNQVQQAPDPADTYGIAVAGITRRQINGRLNPPIELLSTRDVITDFLAGTSKQLWVRFGSAGNGISVYFPAVVYTGREDEDVNGFAHEGIPFADAQGADTGVYISVY